MAVASRLLLVSTALSLSLLGARAWADPLPPDAAEAPPGASPEARAAVDQGAFLGLGVPARNDAQRAFAYFQGGYDGAARSATVQGVAQLRFAGPVSLRAGFGYHGGAGDARPTVALAVDLLRQPAHGLNLAVYAGYEAFGFNTVAALSARVALSRQAGAATFIANLGYGLGLAEGEHYGELRLGALYRVHPRLQLGLDARARLDLERDADEPENEPDVDLIAGPVANLSIDRFVIGATAGVSTVKYRLTPEVYTGALALVTVGSVF
ncbi:MAG: hypothetical protein JNK72_23575 [Myxococcales bacterium]|nr:hypothetical protein [Myxococcales bacterium]